MFCAQCTQLKIISVNEMFFSLLTAVQTLLRYGFGEKASEQEIGEEDVMRFVRQAKPKNTVAIFIGDSHMKMLLPETLEDGLGCPVWHGILPATAYTSGGGHPRRAYNSCENWLNARFPKASQELRVPQLLAGGDFQFLIISLCCNDITNIVGLSPEVQMFLAESSARNTLQVAQNSVRDFQELLAAFIVDAPPRVDRHQLQRLSEYRAKYLNRRLQATPSPKIMFCPLDDLKVQNHDQASVLFAHSPDGIHMSGSTAKYLYTSAVVAAITTANNEL